MLTLKYKLLQHLARSKFNQGFTLIELLVVVIIIGILAAIALPNLLQQVSKGRQAEAINNLGAINRAQQVYRYETGVFGTVGNGTNGTLSVNIQGKYYVYSDRGTPSSLAATHYADVPSFYDQDLKDYSSSVGLTTTGVFSSIICGAINAQPVGGMGDSTNGTTCGHNSVGVK